MKDYSKIDTDKLQMALECFRSTIRKKGTFICVYERGQCERILAELERRKDASR